MPHINSTRFGNIVIGSKNYAQVLILGDRIIERDYDRLKDLFGTSHKIADWEIKDLFKNDPDMVVIGTGQDGMLEIEEDFLDNAKKRNIKVIAEITPEAMELYNEKIKSGKRVNALFHTTC